MENARAQCKEDDHRRGNFNTLRYGVSHGGGHTCPMNFSHQSPEMEDLVRHLNNHPTFLRLAAFQNCMYLAPLLHALLTMVQRSSLPLPLISTDTMSTLSCRFIPLMTPFNVLLSTVFFLQLHIILGRKRFVNGILILQI